MTEVTTESHCHLCASRRAAEALRDGIAEAILGDTWAGARGLAATKEFATTFRHAIEDMCAWVGDEASEAARRETGGLLCQMHYNIRYRDLMDPLNDCE